MPYPVAAVRGTHSFGSGAADPYAGYLVYDTFTDDDATVLASHTPEKDAEGGGWIVLAGTWVIDSNTLDPDATDPGEATIDAGQSNHYAEVTDTVMTQVDGPMVRCVDTNNYWIWITTNDNTRMQLYECDGGGYTSRINVGQASSAGGVLKVTVDADDLFTGFYDDSSLGTYTSALHNTATIVGLWSSGGGATNTKFDDFHAGSV